MENICINEARIAGRLCAPLEFSHTLYGENFYTTTLTVPRLSNYQDRLPLTLSDRLMDEPLSIGDYLQVQGQIRSYNKVLEGANRLVLTIFAKSILQEAEQPENPNDIQLTGHICKQPIYRVTPFHREISDLLIAVNRAYNKSDYIPCIAWGRNARFARNLSVGTKLAITGRMQSREYEKQMEDGTVLTKTAYEVSISSMEECIE